MPEWVRRRLTPWLLWAATMGGVAWLWGQEAASDAVGFVARVEYAVAPPVAGRLAALEVVAGQAVEAGQVLGRLDAAEIDAELAILAAERARLDAAIAAAEIGARGREASTSRELDASLSSAEISLKSAQARRKSKSSELAALSGQAARLRELVDLRMADRSQLDALQVRQAALRSEIEAAESLISQLVGEVASARGRRESLSPETTDQVSAPERAEVAVLDRRQELLEARRADLVLRAPSAGTIVSIHLRPGEVVAAGSPVLTLVGAGEPRVQVCLRERQADRVRVGEGVRLHPRGGGEALSGRVVALEPQVAPLPQRCLRDPRTPEWGREVTVGITEGRPLLAGEAFDVAFTGEVVNAGELPNLAAADQASASPLLTAIDRSAARPTPHASDEAREVAMEVPAELGERSRIEPSGLLWWPPLDRYLVVSDDTGHPGRDDHAPWIFTVDRDGRFDPEPLVLQGIEEVSDLEAIAHGPGESIYVLASQSRSRKGKRPTARQIFAQVELRGRAGEVKGWVALAELLDAAPAIREGLGLPSSAALDVEGMSACAEGGLLIGVKEPLAARGEAMIWRLAEPARLLAGEGLEAAGLALWGTVPLRVSADGAPAAGGIAELLELEDGALLIAATASGGDPSEQSGSLWLADGRARLAVPRHLRDFPGRKPEGLARAPDGGLVVVFDTGVEAPRWMELPWPAP
ncbi:MAG: HlyD family efflux transporter periplasmic adaptor subunit [Myxococcales bacterium]|nr:HlyD family efflux transporter periplasmic adaptor subunit [Myxococcales bacterium]